MNKGSTVNNAPVRPGCAHGSYTKSIYRSKKVSAVKSASQKAEIKDRKDRPAPEQVKTHSQGSIQRSLSTVSTSRVIAYSHQRRWSADFSRFETSSVITVRKTKQEPQPPQRDITLSCSSLPTVKTSVITGHDPLGWKLRPKSSSTSPGARAKRLSLQIPLPIIFQEPKSNPAPENTPKPEPLTKSKPPVKPKPSRRCYSDSSAFLRTLVTPGPVVTLEELCAVHLCPVNHSDELDDVFTEGDKQETTVPRKIPPPVPEKTAMARQIAQLIAHSHQCRGPATIKTKQENIYTSLRKQKPKQHVHQTVHHSSLHAPKTGLHLDTSCDREGPMPRFPGREI
ncbi:uncharacterized protein LOC113135520 [Mastacembelus armatus]|uniref:uncharacterized protein LOC113135520 n=1 Tax=Mastacembelus armatus TaxID=205130 RepID=UPI000E465AB2|nr:uncharacterized protein LOC113135520 [Mastacembelus armatus]